MTLQDIRDAIKVVDGQVVLTPTTLGSAAITGVLKEYGKASTLTISNATIASTPEDAFVTVHGDIGLLNVLVSGDVRVYMGASEAQLDVLGTPPSGWTLGTSFDSLKNSHLATFALSSPSLRLLSEPTSDGPAGLTLSAGFTVPAAMEVLTWFAAPAESATLSGPIALDGGAPSMTLTVSPTITASLGGFVSIELTMQHVSKTFRKDGGQGAPVVTALSLLSGNLSFDHGGTPVTVPLQAGFNGELGVLDLHLVTGNVFDLALAEIAHWLGGTNLATAGLPASYQPPGGLTLHDVNFAIGLQTKSLEYVSLTVQSTGPWVVLGDTITVSGVVLTFMVMPSGSPTLSATIEGTLTLGPVHLDIYAQLPDFLIRGQLAENSPVDLIPLIAHFGGTTGGGLPSALEIDVLSFEAHPAGAFYTFDIDVIGEWQIVDQVTMEGLKASLRYESAVLDVTFAGSFTIGGADVSISAGYDSDQNGWVFSGQAGDKQPLKIGTFIQNLASEFGSKAAQALPDFITSLEIQHLGVTFDTVTKDFVFQCETTFSIEATPLDVTLQVTLTNTEGGYTHLFAGGIVIGSVRFELVFEEDKTGGTDDAGQTSSMFLAAVQPEGKLDVHALVASIDATAGALMPALTLQLENALFLYRKADTDATYLFGLALGLDLDLSSLPLVGSVFKDSNLGSIKDIQVVFASAPVAAADVATFNGLLAVAQANPPLPTKQGATGTTPVLAKGFNFAANIELGGNPLPLNAGGDAAPPDAPPPGPPVPAAPPSGNASWIDIKKSIGPVTLDRIGVRYEDARAWLLLDADFVIAGLSLSLQGLALGLKLDDLTDVAVNLDGMSLDFESGPLSIAGGFLHVGGGYIGEAKVKAGTFGLTAIGGYAPADRSFFIFVRLDVPLGGPPFFFVTGIAGGFGVNRSLVLPPIDGLTSFALLPANNTFPASLDSQNPGQSLAATLASTESYIYPQPGGNWVAAGIDFTSFEMVDCSALVTVAFGVEFAVTLLGICRITVPKGDPEAIVYLEITLEAQFKPSQGLLAVDGRLTPASYLYAQLCKITGGFAFYLWFSGPHEGDFVISIGGYHPRFKKPDNYPVVPRLQLTYQIGALVIKGQGYLAVTPHMVMAGLQLNATWSSGDIKAWFSAGIDFLLGWRPFHYEADAYIHIGVSLKLDLLFTTVTITIHVGVDLSIWGPPFGGKATIDLDIVSFTIYFGDDPRKEAVDWAGFKASFLPAGADKSATTPAAHVVRLAMAAATDPPAGDGLLCTAGIADGLVREVKAKDPTAFLSWIVDANHFAIQSNMLVPAKQATYNAFDLQTPFTKSAAFTPASATAPSPAYDESVFPAGVAWAGDLGVLPMGLGADHFSSHHTVLLRRPAQGDDYTDPTKYVHDVDDIAVGPLVKATSAALWAPAEPGLNGARLIPQTLVGLRLSPMPQYPDVTLKADLWAMLFDQTQQITWQADPPAPDQQDPYEATADGATLSFKLGGQAVTCQDYKLTALTDSGASAARQAVVASLDTIGFTFATDGIDVADLAQYPLWDWPMIRTLGEEVAAS